MAMSLKGAQLPQDIMLMGVRWSVAYPVSDRPVEELMEERGGRLDHATMQRGVVKYRAQMEAAFRHRKRPVGRSWRLDETDIRVTGEWRDLYRAVDTHGQTIDFLLMEERDGLCRKFLCGDDVRRAHPVGGVMRRRARRTVRPP